MSAAETGRRRVLFLYNVPDWAVHNVGKDWAELARGTHDFRLVRFGRHEGEDPRAWDHIVWGYSTLGYSGRILLASLARDLSGWLRWRGADPARLRAVVQDPSEVFPEVEDWRRATPRLGHLRRFRGLAVTSNEMREALGALGLEAVKVNTRSLLPARDPAELAPEPLRVFTRAQTYPRKNLALFEALRRRHAGRIGTFEALLGGAVLPQADYARVIDGYNCYLCTSWQEGGPLPLMDALRRGCVVLTTRVGQTDELVADGGNGFFCADEEDFARRLEQLRSDPELLLRMRREALRRAAADPAGTIRAQLRAFLP